MVKEKKISEEDIRNFFGSASDMKKTEKALEPKLKNKFITKEFFDRLGFGFGSPQYINIFFYLTGASLFLVGLINGIKAIISVLSSLFLQDYYKEDISKTTINISGTLLLVSFILIIISKLYNSIVLFSFAILLTSFGIITYGDIYQKLIRQKFEKEKKGQFLQKISRIGFIIIGISLILAAILFDKLPSKSFNFLGLSFKLYGFIIVFGITAISFFISSYIFSLMLEKKKIDKKKKFNEQIKSFFNKLNLSFFIKNKIMLILIIAASITGIVQTLGNSYYGIFIYKNFYNTGFGGFLNVAIVFLFAILASFLSPFITTKVSTEYGKFPMLVFGTLLMAIMPLAYYYNPYLVSISMATVVGIIGSSITGFAHGMLTLDLIKEKDRKTFFASSNFFIILPYIIGIPIGSYIANTFGLRILFLILGIILAFVVMPLYFYVVLTYNKKKEKI